MIRITEGVRNVLIAVAVFAVAVVGTVVVINNISNKPVNSLNVPDGHVAEVIVQSHSEKGGYISSTETIDGLTVTWKNTQKSSYNKLKAEIEKMPVEIKEKVNGVTFTNDTLLNDTKVNGYSDNISHTIEVKTTGCVYEDIYTLYHEIGHCYDYNDTDFFTYSQEKSFGKVFDSEGQEIADGFYDKESYNDYPENIQKSEIFAITFAHFFTEPEIISTQTPDAYHYMSKLLAR